MFIDSWRRNSDNLALIESSCIYQVYIRDMLTVHQEINGPRRRKLDAACRAFDLWLLGDMIVNRRK